MTLEFGIAVTIAVLVVAQQRMAGEGRVNADLMRASRRNVHLHQGREWSEELHRLEHAHRILAGGGHPHMALAMLAVVGGPGGGDTAWFPLPPDRHITNRWPVHIPAACIAAT